MSLIDKTLKTSISAASSIKGDLSGNGKIDLYDAIEISKYIMGLRTLTHTQEIIADYNYDGSVNLYDAIAISKHIMDSKPAVPWLFTTLKPENVIITATPVTAEHIMLVHIMKLLRKVLNL